MRWQKKRVVTSNTQIIKYPETQVHVRIVELWLKTEHLRQMTTVK